MRISLAMVVACLALLGCGTDLSESDRDAGRWTAALIEAVEPLPHIAELQDVGYSLQGPFTHNTAWIIGSVWSDSNDEQVNRELLDGVGRAVAASLAENTIADSWVKIQVVSASGRAMALSELGLPTTPTLDDLAEHYGIPRG